MPIAFLLRRTLVVDLTHRVAKILGRWLGERRMTDAVDAHVVFLARERGWPILTSDIHDLRALDPTLRLQKV